MSSNCTYDPNVAPTVTAGFPLTRLVLEVRYDCLDREEREIRRVRDRCVSSNRNSIRAYEERWFQYLLLKTARERPQCPSVAIEDRRVDAKFIDNDGRDLATFEFKGPFG